MIKGRAKAFVRLGCTQHDTTREKNFKVVMFTLTLFVIGILTCNILISLKDYLKLTGSTIALDQSQRSYAGVYLIYYSCGLVVTCLGFGLFLFSKQLLHLQILLSSIIVTLPVAAFVARGCQLPALGLDTKWAPLLFFMWVGTNVSNRTLLGLSAIQTLTVVILATMGTMNFRHGSPCLDTEGIDLDTWFGGKWVQHTANFVCREIGLVVTILWWQKRERRNADELANVAHAAAQVATRIANYDVEFDLGDLLDCDTELFGPLEKILFNLKMYKPFLPDSLFVKAHTEEQDNQQEGRGMDPITTTTTTRQRAIDDKQRGFCDLDVNNDSSSSLSQPVPTTSTTQIGISSSGSNTTIAGLVNPLLGRARRGSAKSSNSVTSTENAPNIAILNVPLTFRRKVTCVVFRLAGMDSLHSTLGNDAVKWTFDNFVQCVFSAVHERGGQVMRFGTTDCVAVWNTVKITTTHALSAVTAALQALEMWKQVIDLPKTPSVLVQHVDNKNITLHAAVCCGSGTIGTCGPASHQTLHYIGTRLTDVQSLLTLTAAAKLPILIDKSIYNMVHYDITCYPVDNVTFNALNTPTTTNSTSVYYVSARKVRLADEEWMYQLRKQEEAAVVNTHDIFAKMNQGQYIEAKNEITEILPILHSRIANSCAASNINQSMSISNSYTNLSLSKKGSQQRTPASAATATPKPFGTGGADVPNLAYSRDSDFSFNSTPTVEKTAQDSKILIDILLYWLKIIEFYSTPKKDNWKVENIGAGSTENLSGVHLTPSCVGSPASTRSSMWERSELKWRLYPWESKPYTIAPIPPATD